MSLNHRIAPGLYSWIVAAALGAACGRGAPSRVPALVPSAAAMASASPGACVGPGPSEEKPGARNVQGSALSACRSRHTTGFYRDGFCHTGPGDAGVHVVCSQVTDAFLSFSRAHGNDLVTPRGTFAGLRAGDAWCLCAARWQEALQAGVAPPVDLLATDAAALTVVTRAALSSHALAR